MASIFGLDDFSIFYSSAPAMGTSKCIIMSNNHWKIMWDVWILMLLLVIVVIVPWRLAFYGDRDIVWIVIYWVIDFFFLIDIILTFFTSVSDGKNIMEITDRK